MSYANELELYMLELINAERFARNLTLFQLETNLNSSAEIHSEWMLDTNTFSHTGAAGSSATNRIVAADFDLSGSWGTAENLAVQSVRGAEGYFDDVQDLHNGLMNSPGHLANLINPDLRYIGIGIEIGDFTYSSGPTLQSVMITQNFARTHGSVDLDDLEGGQAVPAGETLTGDDTRNTLTGTAGSDVITGAGGSDSLLGGAGHDTIDGGTGGDTVEAGSGNDSVLGGTSVDMIHGDAGDDTLRGGTGADTLYGGEGNDSLLGNTGQDTLYGGDGDDLMLGSQGRDLLEGGAGNDTIRGGSLEDTFVFATGDGNDVISDFEVGVDTLSLTGDVRATAASAADLITLFGEVVNGQAVLRFDADTSITFENLTNLTGLANDIEFIA